MPHASCISINHHLKISLEPIEERKEERKKRVSNARLHRKREEEKKGEKQHKPNSHN